MEKIFVIGAGGHAKVVASILEEERLRQIVWFIDDDPSRAGEIFHGYPILGSRKRLLEETRASEIGSGLVAIGDNVHRMEAVQWLGDNGFELITAIHPSSWIARGVSIAEGTVLMAGTIVNSDTAIGRAVILNTGATIDHDCVIADGVHVAPGCHLCGNVKVGRETFIGAGSTVVPGILIGEGAVVGAGSVVLRDVPDHAKVAGNPCRSV
jgi:sugar O-acyltransferase (sialic acid O-acetyltransferase NeuD family)